MHALCGRPERLQNNSAPWNCTLLSRSGPPGNLNPARGWSVLIVNRGALTRIELVEGTKGYARLETLRV
jgi:hypothetical protein